MQAVETLKAGHGAVLATVAGRLGRLQNGGAVVIWARSGRIWRSVTASDG